MHLNSRMFFSQIQWFALTALVVWLAACAGENTGRLQGVVQLQGLIDAEGVEIVLPGTQFRAVSDSDGVFLIAGVPPGSYTLLARNDGFDDHRQEIEIQPGRLLQIETFELAVIKKPAGSISGFVRAEGRTTHENIAVLLVGSAISAFTNTTGFFRLTDVPPGEYLLMAFKEGWAPSSREKVVVRDGQDEPIEEILLTQSPLMAMAHPQAPVLGERVLRGAVFLEGKLEHDGIRVYLSEAPEHAAITSATGAFEIAGLDDRRYTLIFSYPGFIDKQLPSVQPALPGSIGGVGYITLEAEFNPERMGILQGRVYLEDQDVHANTMVRLIGVSQSVVTGEDGRYMFIAIPEGEYTLSAEHPGYATAEMENIRVAPEQILQAPDITLSATFAAQSEETGEIRGIGLLQGEFDHGGISVAVEGTGFSSVTSFDGEYVLPDVPYGAYTLIFSKGGFKNIYYEGASVLAGQTTVLEPVVLFPDVDPPFVVETFPRTGTRRVPVIDAVDALVRFSERMAGDTVKRSVRIDPPIDFEAYFDRESEYSDLDVLHLRLPQNAPNPVQFKTRYVVTIIPEARTPKGVPIAQPYQFDFTTDGPLIVRTVPETGSRGMFVSSNTPLMIFTNAPVDPVTFERSLRVRPKPDSEPLFEYYPFGAGTRVQVKLLMRTDARYRVQIENSLRTQAGERFSNTPYLFNFSTVEIGSSQRRGGYIQRVR
ncbi:MAG: carboxypeptidase regulatory-like domain-containing protein [Candidatus Hinthialibacter antarcticus]|nr:carboxypeptidase regulatory-like domain-containing protein [Candidatus Hinthialibacter antarcticus]